MGAGSHYHVEVVDYLEKLYRSTLSRKYSFKDVMEVGRGKFQADYVCDKAWIDVVHDEGWMKSLGKFIVYGNQIINEDKEFWLVFYAISLWDKEGGKGRYKDMSKPEFVTEKQKHYAFYLRTAQNALREVISNRVRVLDYESDGDSSTGRLYEIRLLPESGFKLVLFDAK